MRSLPKLSVVMPNYNHAQHLPVSLGAILQQSVQPDEIIVLDDASTDNSVEVIQQFAIKNPHVRLERNDRNRGVVYGMNRGLELARNEYLYFAAADDQVLPGLFEKSLTLLQHYPEAALCFAVSEWREIASGLTRHVGLATADEPCYLSPSQLLDLGKQGKLLIASPTVVMSRTSILRAGGFIPELRWHCDWFAIYVAAFRQGVCFVPEALAVFNIHPTSFSERQNLRAHQEARRKMLEHLLQLLTSPEYADIAPFMRESGSLFLLGKPMLRLLLTHRRYRHFLNPTFLRQNLWFTLKMDLKKFTPRFAAEWYFRIAGHKLPSGD